jgi:Fe2+ transport system protein FeoA
MTVSTILWVTVAVIAFATVAFVARRLSSPRELPAVDERAAGLMAAGLLPLVDCPRDRDACLRCLQVDRCVVHRLIELGLTPGTRVRVVQDAGGPMLLSVRGSRVALGRDLAERVWVELPDLEPCDIPRG